MGKSIQRLEVQIAQYVPNFRHRYNPLGSGHSEAHESAIEKHLFSVNCDANYSAVFFPVLHSARENTPS